MVGRLGSFCLTEGGGVRGEWGTGELIFIWLPDPASPIPLTGRPLVVNSRMQCLQIIYTINIDARTLLKFSCERWCCSLNGGCPWGCRDGRA